VSQHVLLVDDAGTFEAMASDRPYRKAMPVDAALEEAERAGPCVTGAVRGIA